MREIALSKKDKIKAIAETLSYIDSLSDDKLYTITIKEKKKCRSLNANSYAWVLLDKLAQKLNMPKTELYRNYIKEIGGVSDIVCVVDNAVDKLCSTWEKNGIGYQTDLMPSKISGCTNVVLYYGSSTYDTSQMSRLINLIVQDCKENEIDTLTPDELYSMCEDWR